MTKSWHLTQKCEKEKNSEFKIVQCWEYQEWLSLLSELPSHYSRANIVKLCCWLYFFCIAYAFSVFGMVQNSVSGDSGSLFYETLMEMNTEQENKWISVFHQRNESDLNCEASSLVKGISWIKWVHEAKKATGESINMQLSHNYGTSECTLVSELFILQFVLQAKTPYLQLHQLLFEWSEHNFGYMTLRKWGNLCRYVHIVYSGFYFKHDHINDTVIMLV
jgi:hypothetical protein